MIQLIHSSKVLRNKTTLDGRWRWLAGWLAGCLDDWLIGWLVNSSQLASQSLKPEQTLIHYEADVIWEWKAIRLWQPRADSAWVQLNANWTRVETGLRQPRTDCNSFLHKNYDRQWKENDLRQPRPDSDWSWPNSNLEWKETDLKQPRARCNYFWTKL